MSRNTLVALTLGTMLVVLLAVSGYLAWSDQFTDTATTEKVDTRKNHD